jgi:hypothetical protein
MTDSIALAIEELSGKIAVLTDLRDKLVTFRREWPHTAAAMVPVAVAPAPRPSTTRAAPSIAVDPEQAILDTLKAGGGSIKPGELARALDLSPVAMRRAIAPLLQSKAVIVTGATAARRFCLPTHAPAPPPERPRADPADVVANRDATILAIFRQRRGALSVGWLLSQLPAESGMDDVSKGLALEGVLRRLRIKGLIESAGKDWRLVAS